MSSRRVSGGMTQQRTDHLDRYIAVFCIFSPSRLTNIPLALPFALVLILTFILLLTDPRVCPSPGPNPMVSTSNEHPQVDTLSLYLVPMVNGMDASGHQLLAWECHIGHTFGTCRWP